MNLKTAIKYISITALFVIGISWIYYLSKFGLNLPRTADDTRFFLHQFQVDYLNAESLLDKLKYFGSISNWPHTKIVGRVIQVLQYHLTGQVNFQSVSFLGNLLYLPLIFCLGKMVNKEYFILALVSLTAWLLVPVFNSYWPIFSVSFAGNLLMAWLILWSGLHRKFSLFFVLSLLSVFVHGHIVIVPFITVILLLIKQYVIQQKGLTKLQFLTLVLSLIFATAIFYFHILENPIRRSNQSLGSEVALLQKLAATSIYTVTYLTRSLTEILFGKSYNTTGLTFGIPVIIYSLIILIKSLIKGNTKTYTIIGLVGLCVASALLAGWVRNDGLSFTPTVAPRYEYWSAVFYALISLLSIDTWIKVKNSHIILLGLALVFYGVRMSTEVSLKKSIAKQRINYIGDILGNYKDLSTGDKIVSQKIKKAIEDNIYSPPINQLHYYKSLSQKQIKGSGSAKIYVIKHSRSAFVEYLTIGINSKVNKSDKLFIYWKKGKTIRAYEPLELSTTIGLKQGFDNQLQKPDIPHLVLLSCVMPPNADEVGVIKKKKDQFVTLKTIAH